MHANTHIIFEVDRWVSLGTRWNQKLPPIRDEPVIDNNKVKMAERERKVPDNHSSTTCSETNGDTTSK